MGRTQSQLGARAVAGPRRLLSSTGHDVFRLCRISPLLHRRVRSRRPDCRHPLQPRRTRVATSLEKIARKRIGYANPRWGHTPPYPEEAVAGPVVALTNEHAGSDGDIFSHAFKLMGIGPLVGTRTWGGVIGIWPRHTLVDGTQTTQPEYSFWFSDVGWGVENYGTEPQIEVDNAPQDTREGRDRQLETALATALGLIERTVSDLPQFGERPNLRRSPLPPRR